MILMDIDYDNDMNPVALYCEDDGDYYTFERVVYCRDFEYYNNTGYSEGCGYCEECGHGTTSTGYCDRGRRCTDGKRY